MSKRVKIPPPEYIPENHKWCNFDKHNEIWILNHKDAGEQPMNPIPIFDITNKSSFYGKRNICIDCYKTTQNKNSSVSSSKTSDKSNKNFLNVKPLSMPRNVLFNAFEISKLKINNDDNDCESDSSSVIPQMSVPLLYINTTFQIKKESDTNIKISEIQNVINELQNTIEQLIKNKNNLENKILQIDDGDDDNGEIKNLNHEIMIYEGKILQIESKILLMKTEIKKLK